MRPPKDPEINAAYNKQLGADQRKRNEVEGGFGSGKRKYALKLVMARLAKGAETSISMAILVMSVEKIQRFSRLLFCHYLSLVLHLAKTRLPLRSSQEHLPA